MNTLTVKHSIKRILCALPLVFIITFFFSHEGNAQALDTLRNSPIYLQNTLFSGLKYVQQGMEISVGPKNRNLLYLMQAVPKASQEIELANKYYSKASLYSLLGSLGGLGLAIAGGATKNDGLILAGAGIFSVGTFVSLRFSIKGFNSLNKGVWMYNQHVCP